MTELNQTLSQINSEIEYLEYVFLKTDRLSKYSSNQSATEPKLSFDAAENHYSSARTYLEQGL